ncbi:MAG: type III pantothenate kinase [Methylophilaceae bacterium]|nr:MAG: type III pantothenate kinase [Methylophilaceae bacterium]
MLIVIDAGNTRVKWAEVQKDGRLGAMQAVTNAGIKASTLVSALSQAEKVMIANVAGATTEQLLTEMMPEKAEVVFATPQAEACHVINQYEKSETLGIDRWAAVIAAWHMNKQPSIVVNAGTAITIDALSKDKTTKKGAYIGGSIMPGLQPMLDALSGNTANLSGSAGIMHVFPKNTQDAIHTGCMNAVVGAVVLQMKQLEKHCAFLPKIVISGGDAVKIAEALTPQLKRVVVVEDLVLQGLALLEKETV